MVEATTSPLLPYKSLESPPVLPELGQLNRRAFNTILAGVFLGVLPTIARSCEAENPDPLGSLIIGGGGELSPETHDRFIDLAGGKNARIVVIPTASDYANDPDQTVDMYWDGKERVASAVLLHTNSREKANSPDFGRPLIEATGVWFSGGDQNRLADAYVDTLVEEEIGKVLRRGGIVGGTSAGAAILSPVMIAGGNPIPTLGKGFQFLKQFLERNCILDTHFDTRNRIHRLLNALKEHPKSVGLGIYWGSALLINDSDVTVMGKNTMLCNAEGKSKEYVPGEKVDLSALDTPPPTAIASVP